MSTTIAVIGGGNMGEAIISGIHKEYEVSVCEKESKRAHFLKRRYGLMVANLKTVIERSEIIILAVKPQSFENLLKEIRSLVNEDKLLISIAAGITCAYIEKRLNPRMRVVRTMPNLPAQVGEGVTGVCIGKYAKKSDLVLTRKIFTHIGKTIPVKENLMDTITAISGSGPAYLFYFAECFEKAASSMGIKGKIGKELVVQTLKGSIKLLEPRKDSATDLRKRVTSKGGTTEAALDVFTKKKLDKTFKEALTAAKKRAKQLSK